MSEGGESARQGVTASEKRSAMADAAFQKGAACRSGGVLDRQAGRGCSCGKQSAPYDSEYPPVMTGGYSGLEEDQAATEPCGSMTYLNADPSSNSL